MGVGEYRGPGGLIVLLDEPLNSEMAKQLSSGHLSRVGGAPKAEGSEREDFAGPKPESRPAAPEGKPAVTAKVDDWRAYAVSLGMSEEDAASATKKDCQEYVQVVEDAAEGQE
ncbi:hypothetical protein [Streptomyces sp. CBG30]|uniref:hypothetical protein n=1 Tax=Streptomyces sp. CBG30 TaxID=2838869 RepID=UPI00103E49B6|nr:hypothetical protein [Streptomyces sp. CBG30]MBT3098985.1 hypothetical protein [Streptomyces sp. CBG30]MBT3103566.1 hypothetical protein [Streptomyces sp. COG19]